MPPVLISSAAGKKTAGPKAPPARRRPAAPGPAPSSQTTPSAATSVAPQSPPPAQPPAVEEPVQVENAQEEQSAPAVSEPEPEPVREDVSKQTPQEPVTQTVSQPELESTRDDVPSTGVDAVAVSTPASAQVDQPSEAPNVEREQDQELPADPVPEPVVEPTLPQASNPPANAEQTEPQGQTVVGIQPTQELAQASPVSQPAPPTRSASKRTRNEASTSTAPRPAKKAKRSSARSNATVQANVQADDDHAMPDAPVENGESSATPAPPQSQARSQKRKQPSRKATTTQRNTKSKAKSAATITNSDDEDETVPSPESPEDEETSVEPAPRKPKQRRKKKQVRIAANTEVEGDGGRPEEVGAGGEGGNAEEEQNSDDSDPELHEIDPNTLSMFDLSHETKYGKTSERGKAMAEIDWEEVAQKRRAEAQAIASNQQEAPAGEVVQSVEGPDGTTELQSGDAEQAPAAPAANGTNAGNEEFLVDADGNIVLDESTVRHDATAQALQAAETGAVEDVNDLTATLNRTTWINNNRRDPTDRVPMWKWKSDPWSEEETDRFYDALTMFGSDFFIISKMFPGKNRRMIKAKFNREEKLDPQRIDDALTGKSTKTMDLEHYSRETGRDMSVFMRYEGLEHAQGIINESMKDKHEAMTAAAEQEAAAAEEKAAREKSEKREKSRTAKQARKKRAKGGGTLGGAPDDAGAD